MNDIDAHAIIIVFFYKKIVDRINYVKSMNVRTIAICLTFLLKHTANQQISIDGSLIKINSLSCIFWNA